MGTLLHVIGDVHSVATTTRVIFREGEIRRTRCRLLLVWITLVSFCINHLISKAGRLYFSRQEVLYYKWPDVPGPPRNRRRELKTNYLCYTVKNRLSWSIVSSKYVSLRLLESTIILITMNDRV